VQRRAVLDGECSELHVRRQVACSAQIAQQSESDFDVTRARDEKADVRDDITL
jgi:hypothetical protein